MIITARDIDWNDFFNSGFFEDIMDSENKSWIVTLELEIPGKFISEAVLTDVTDIDRHHLLAVNSLIRYHDNAAKNKRGRKRDQPDKLVIKYDFIHKIIDHRNNLIIIADVDQHDFSYAIPLSNEEVRKLAESKE